MASKRTSKNHTTAVWTVGVTTENHPYLGTVERKALYGEDGRLMMTFPMADDTDRAVALVSIERRWINMTTVEVVYWSEK